MNLAEKKLKDAQDMADHRARLDAWLGPDEPRKEQPRIITAPVKKSGWDDKSVGNVLKHIAAHAPMNAPPPRQSNRHTRRKLSKFERKHRYDFARDLEAFRRDTRAKTASGRMTMGAISPAGVEIVKWLAFEKWNGKTGQCDPSHETIAESTGYSVATVGRQLKAAQANGIVGWLRRAAFFIAGEWRRRTNTYHFGWPTASKVDSRGIQESMAPLPDLDSTLRDVASRSGCNFLT